MHLKKTILLSMLLSGFAFGSEFSLGVATPLLTNKLNSVDANFSNEMIKKNGFRFVRMDASWRDVEKQKGIYKIPTDWDSVINDQLKKGIEPILILAYGNRFYNNNDKPITDDSIDGFKKYTAFLVKHFEGRVKYYQIWNEWNGSAGPTSPGKTSDYKKLVKEVYPVIKGISPEAKVITGEFSNGAFNKELGLTREDFLKDFLTDDMAKYTDIIGIHPYVLYRTPPYNSYSVYLSQINYSMDLVKGNKAFSNKPVFITEIGWSTSDTDKGVSQEKQADFTFNAICDAKKIGISAVIIYRLQDSKPSLKHPTEPGFGLFDVDWKPKKVIDKLEREKCN